MTTRRLALAALASSVAASTSGCGGSGDVRTHGMTPAAARVRSASVAFSITIPKNAIASASRRGRDYVSTATQSVQIVASLAGMSDVTATLDCSSGQTCTTQILAPVGTDAFAVKTFDKTGATGNLLGIGKTMATIVDATANTLNVTLDGVVDSVTLALDQTHLAAGKSGTDRLIVNAMDRDGRTIVAPGGYVDTNGNPLTITPTVTNDGSCPGKTTIAGATFASSGGSETVAYDGGALGSATFSATVSRSILGSVQGATLSYDPTIGTRKTLATNPSQPMGIVLGSDGAMWFAETTPSKIGRLVPATATTMASITETPTQATTAGGQLGSELPEYIASGSDGNLWFALANGNSIGRLTTAAGTPANTVTEFPLPTTNAHPNGIAAGSDKNLWFTEQYTSKIGSITPQGVVIETALTNTNAQPFAIAPGSDKNLWFTEFLGNAIGRITTGVPAVVTEFPLPTVGANATSIAPGPDGALWFTEQSANKIGRIDTMGKITEFALPAADPNIATNANDSSQEPYGIVAGCDGNLYFTLMNTKLVARMSTLGAMSFYPLDPATIGPRVITPGPDAHLWFTEFSSNAVTQLFI